MLHCGEYRFRLPNGSARRGQESHSDIMGKQVGEPWRRSRNALTWIRGEGPI